MEYGLKNIAFYVENRIILCTVIKTSLLVRHKPLGAPAFVKQVYSIIGSYNGLPPGRRQAIIWIFDG